MSNNNNGRNNTFQDVNNFISGPIGQFGLSQASSYMNQYRGYAGQIFTPQIRAYFDVSTELVGRKLCKILFPFKQFEWDNQIKKLELYIPIISLATLVLFSTISDGIVSEFDPRIGKKLLWVIILSFIEVAVAKCSESAISNLNIGFLQLSSLISYRFVPLALLTIILTINGGAIPYINLIGLVYLLLSDTYFCKIQLNNCEREVFNEGGLGTKIALIFHFFMTIVISWVCDIV